MFELESEVRNWRTRVERGSSLSPRELDELEDHLRARVDLELELNPGLSPVDALAIAQEGLGQPTAISREFAKAGRRLLAVVQFVRLRGRRPLASPTRLGTRPPEEEHRVARRTSWRRAWTAWVVAAAGALPSGLGLLRIADGGMGWNLGVGYWMWCASFFVVATALWLRNHAGASIRPTTTDGPVK